MPDFVINIKVNTTGARPAVKETEDGLKRIEREANKARAALMRMVAGLGLIQLGRQILGLADTMQTLHNKIRLVTPAADLAFDKLFTIAQKTRQPIEAVVTTFSRSALAMKQFGYSTQQSIDFTESLSTAVAVSGANSIEAAQALYQLSQALGKGKLDGDEFKSVAEELPIVLNLIAAKLHVARGELPSLAKAGKITTEVLVKTFIESKKTLETLEAQLKKMPLTLSGAFTQFKNSIIKAMSDAEKGTGIFRKLADAVGFLARNFDLVVTVVTDLAVGVGAILVGRTLVAMIRGFQRLGLALTTVSGAMGALVAAIAWMIANGDKLDALLGGISRPLLGKGGLSGKEASQLASAQLAEFGVGPELLRNIGQGANREKIQALIDEATAGVARAAASAKGQTTVAQIEALNAQMSQGLLDSLNEKGPPIKEKPDKEAEKFAKALEALRRELDPTYRLAQEYAEAMTMLDKANLDATTDADLRSRVLQRFQEDLVGLVEDGVNPAVLAMREYDAALRILDDAHSRGAFKETYDDIKSRLGTKLDLALSAAGEERNLFGTSRLGLEGDIEAEMERRQAEFEGAERLAELNERLRREANTFEAGTIRGMEAVEAKATDVAGAVETAWVNTFNNIEEALLDFVTGAKVDFKGLVNELLRDLARLALRGIGKSLLSGGDGPQLKSFESIFGAQYGADFRVGGVGGTDSQLVMFRATPGERVTVTPEARQGAGGIRGRGMPGGRVGGRAEDDVQSPIYVNVIYDPTQIAYAIQNTPAGRRAVAAVISESPELLRQLRR